MTASTPPDQDTGAMGAWRALPGVTKAAAILAVAGFVVRLSSESRSVNNGVVTDCSYFDLGALVLGLSAVLTGSLSIVAGRRTAKATLIVGIGIVAVLLGVLHVARGLGTFHDCETGASSIRSDAATFGPDDVTDQLQDQLSDDTVVVPDVPATIGTTSGEVATEITVAADHRGETLTLTVPDDWTVVPETSGTPTRQELSRATSGDGSIELTGYASGLLDDEVAGTAAELAAEGWTETTVAGQPAWRAVDRGSSVGEDHRVVVIAGNLLVSLSFGVVDPEATGADLDRVIDDAVASLTLG